MSSPITRSYADAARSPGRRSSEENSGPFAYSVNRKNSGPSEAAPPLGPVVTIEEPIRAQPSSRRPSIAEVLGRRLSRSSQASGLTPSPSSLPAVQEHEENTPPRSARKKKRSRPKNRRRTSSKTRDHGDFNAFHAQQTPAPVRPVSISEPTPLIRAISAGNVSKVGELLSDESYLDDTSSHPLQAAALEGNEAIVKLLLGSLLESGNFDIDARDSRERTAVYCATSRGHESIVKILLEHNAEPLSPDEEKIAKQELTKWRLYESQVQQRDDTASQQEQTFENTEIFSEPEDNSAEDARSIQSPPPTPGRTPSRDVDHLYRLIVGSAETIKEKVVEMNDERRAAQQRGEWVRGPLKDVTLPSPQKEIGTQQKHVRYPGFGFEIPVVEFDFSPEGGHRIVSPTPTVDDLLYGAQGVDTIAEGSGPAYNATCRWYHIPANHLGWAEDLIRRIYDRRSIEEQRKRDVILGREPFKVLNNDLTQPTSLEPRPQSRAIRAFCRNMTLDRDGTQRLSTALALHIPFVHWETEESRAEMNYVMETIRQGRKNDLDNMDNLNLSHRCIPDLKDIQKRPRWCRNEKMLCAYLYHHPPVHARRTLDQFYYHMLENTEERDQDQVITRYYHNVWKRNLKAPIDEDEFNFAMPAAQEHEFPFHLDNVIEEKPTLEHRDTIRSNHSTEDFPPPGRADTSLSRKISKTPSTEAKEPRFVMMVDQLWLWILDEKTIITSFPQNWTRDDTKPISEVDPRDVLNSIHDYLTLVNRPPLESVHDLAQLVVFKCLETFCKKRTPYGMMQILDVYESAIASVTDRETKVFNKFAAESKKKRTQNKESESPDDPEKLYNIDEEIELLKEIKDIQDELHILSVLLENQSTVLHDAAEAMSKRIELQETKPISPRIIIGNRGLNKPGQEAPYRSTFNFDRLDHLVTDQEKRRKTLQTQAETANKALNHLLDLKQKQANVSEARSARLTSESTKQQGNIMVLFTLVTIIFAPLSLIATIFSLRIIEFPQNLHMSFVFQYMFGISVAIIFPMVLLVIYTTRVSIAKVLRRLEKRVVSWKWFHKLQWERQKRDLKKQLEEKEGDYASSSGFSTEKEQAEKRVPFWRGQVGKEIVDAEKGVANGKSVG